MTRPVRILELRSVYGTGGGPEKTILLGAQRATGGRFAVTVCHIRDARDTDFAIGTRAECQGLEYVELVERHSVDPRLWPALRRLVRERDIDIVHSHDYKTNLLALMVARSEGKIPLATAHGWTGHTRRERWLYYPSDRFILRSFPMTIAVSGQIRANLLEAGVNANRIRVILNGIDHHAFRRDRMRRAAVRRELALDTGDIAVGSVGRLEPQKRFDLLIRACADLQSRMPGLRLLIAGDGSLRDELGRLGAQLMRPGTFSLLGHRSDVVSIHHALDVFVQSSDYEGTSNAVLEAMALETPIVATDAGGTVEIVGDAVHGLIVPTGDVPAIAQAIAHTLSHRIETTGRVAHARRRIETVLSFDARMAALEQVYDELMEARGHTAVMRDAGQCA